MLLSNLDLLGLLFIHLLAIAAACKALLNKRDPRSALGWTVVLVFLPAIGLILYLLFGISRAQSRAEKIMRRHAHVASNYHKPCHLVTDPGDLDPESRSMAFLGSRVTAEALCQGNSIEPLHNGDQAYPAMIEAINAAKNHAYLTTYIFNSGKVAGHFIEALSAARARGVDVRILMDGVGALYSWHKPWKILAQKGVKTALFLPPRLFPPNFTINLRLHRKVLVCDEIGFTGGMNIADEDLSSAGKNCIQDVHFRCLGPVVAQLRHAFLLNWGFCTGDYEPLPQICPSMQGAAHCRVVMDGPGNDADVLNDLICGMINIAHKRVRIMTPYFLPSHDLMAALRSAAQRGVDLRVILPAKNNLPYMNWASKRLLPDLLNAGVRVFFQPPPFAHSKLLTVDDAYSLIGSANLDARSLRLNFELNMEVIDKDLQAHLTTFMDETITKSQEISVDDLMEQPLYLKLRNAACWLFSPYL